MKALLDEQLSSQIAVLLRQRGYDVVAVVERADLVGCSDRTVLQAATNEGRVVVTNNVKDFRPLAAELLARGQAHGGLILLPSSRTRTRGAVVALVTAIDNVLRDNPDGLNSSERWVGPVASG